MTEHTITNWLVIDWKAESTRTRKSKPSQTDLGTNELATKLTLDVEIPEVEVDELRAKVKVPKPRVEKTALEDIDDENAPGWVDVADEVVDDYLESLDNFGDWMDHRADAILEVVEHSPEVVDVEAVRDYCNREVRRRFKEQA